MNSKRLHAYQIMLRVARVKEIRASMKLAVAKSGEAQHRAEHDRLVESRASVVAACDAQLACQGDLDMGRYEMLTQLGEALDEGLEGARGTLASAEEVSRQLAKVSVSAARHRENMGEQVDVAYLALAHVRASRAWEEAIERWLRSETR